MDDKHLEQVVDIESGGHVYGEVDGEKADEGMK